MVVGISQQELECLSDINIDELTGEDLSSDTLIDLYCDADRSDRTVFVIKLKQRSRQLNMSKQDIDALFKAYLLDYKEELKRQNRQYQLNSKEISYKSLEQSEEFFEYAGSYYSGTWYSNAQDQIVKPVVNPESFEKELVACTHPLLPVRLYNNIQTGKEKVKLLFKKGNANWKDVVVEKSVIASTTKITALADYGIEVNSVNAKNLIMYLSEVISRNITGEGAMIETRTSTEKLGWINGSFLPYDSDNIELDSQQQFTRFMSAIKPKGNREEWFELVGNIRKSGRREPLFCLACSLASVLIADFNALPFIFNLYGESGKGKTVALMLAASVWANPDGNNYIVDAKSTQTGLELTLGFFNHLPLMVDDLAQLKSKYDNDLSEMIYALCAGSSKVRAQKNLELRTPSTWQNVIVTNSEHPMTSESMSGGAVNRVIDVEIGDGYIFKNGNQVVETIKKNYGFLGKEFVEMLKGDGLEKVREYQKDFYSRIVKKAQLERVEKEEKQIIPMSIILATDKLVNEEIFKDGVILDFQECFNIIGTKDMVSDNEKAYWSILDVISANENHFIKGVQQSTKVDNKIQVTANTECWGRLISYNQSADDFFKVEIIKSRFTDICAEIGIPSKHQLVWLKKNGLLECSKGRLDKTARINNVPCRVVTFLIKQEEEGEEFEEAGDIPFEF